MGRGRGKGKKLNANHEDPGSVDEERIPAQKRRGRPQKPPKDDIDEEEVEKLEDDDSEIKSMGLSSKGMNPVTAGDNEKKRKQNSLAKENENGVETMSSTDDSAKSNGFRHIGSRRKSKPRRAAEVGVECK